MARQSAIVVMLARVVADWLGIGERARVVVAIVVMLARVVVVGVLVPVVVLVAVGVPVAMSRRDMVRGKHRIKYRARHWTGDRWRRWSRSGSHSATHSKL